MFHLRQARLGIVQASLTLLLLLCPLTSTLSGGIRMRWGRWWNLHVSGTISLLAFLIILLFEWRYYIHWLLFVVVAVMMMTGLLRIIQFTIHISLEHIFNRSVTSSDNINPVGRKLVVGTHSHVASQHQGDAHLLHDRGNIRLAFCHVLSLNSKVRTLIIRTEASKEMRNFHHCIFISRIIHETSKAINDRR